MSETVYFLGAGVNRGLTNSQGQKPPLDGDFFQLLAAQGEALPNETVPRGAKLPLYEGLRYDDVPQLNQASRPPNIYWVYRFIQRFWHASPRDLASKPFSLEELLTFLQLLRQEAKKSRNAQRANEYLFTELVLEHRLSVYLSEFSQAARLDAEMAQFGSLVYEGGSTVITTNYDLIIEAVIQEASDSTSAATSKRSVPAWNMRDSYPVWFSKNHDWEKKVPSKRTPPLMLKLHGSLNWGSIVDIRASIPRTAKDLLLYLPGEFTGDYMTDGANVYKPLIVPMVLYKAEYYGHPAIRAVWRQARRELAECRNLTVMGYSFPPTDFHVKKLFLEALSQRRLRKLTIVNPDTSVVQRIKYITHFEKPIVICNDIGEFLIQL